MKRILTIALTAVIATAAMAMPAKRTTRTVTQPDGTTLTLQLVGDEMLHYYVNIADGTAMWQNADGSFVAIEQHSFAALREAADTRRTAANRQRLARLERYTGLSYNFTETGGTLTAPHRTVGEFNNHLQGSKKGLVILVNFTDLTQSIANPQEEWDHAFNEVGYSKNNHVGSVHDYFYDQSYGQFDLTFDVVGPVTVSRNMSYYGQNNSYGSDAHAAEMVAEACQLADEFVDFKDYDWDGDGEVDQVYVIYAGYGESSGAPAETIWPHEFWLEYGYGKKLNLDGVTINTYACSCELRGDGREGGRSVQNGIGTACHEFSHCIGYPDFYDVNYGGCFGMDAWDVLASGGYNGPTSCCEVPAGFTAYERWMAGWLEPIELSEGADITDMPCLLDEPVAYILRNKSRGTASRPVDEYFLLENRQGNKWFAYPGRTTDGTTAHGMLVTHVNFKKDEWTNNTVNVASNAQGMSIIPAGKTFGAYNTAYKSWYPTHEDYRSMLFPGSKGVTELTNTSHYDCGAKLQNRNSDGTYNMNIPLTAITETGGKISFLVMGGKDEGFRWKVDFDPCGGTTTTEAWQQQQNGETITLPEATANVEGWKFMGWTPEHIEGTTKTRPTTLLEAGTVYRPTADVTLSAVYAIAAGAELQDEFILTTKIKDGGAYVLASRNTPSDYGTYAIDAAALTLGTATRQTAGTEVTVDFDATTPTITTPAEGLIWKATESAGLVALSNADGLFLTIASGGLALADTPSVLYWDEVYGLYGRLANGSSYYVHVGSGKFSVSATKQENSRLYLYEKDDLANKDVYYSHYPSADFVPEGIGSVRNDVSATSASAGRYTIDGRRPTTTAKGITIENGRKTIL